MSISGSSTRARPSRPTCAGDRGPGRIHTTRARLRCCPRRGGGRRAQSPRPGDHALPRFRARRRASTPPTRRADRPQTERLDRPLRRPAVAAKNKARAADRSFAPVVERRVAEENAKYAAATQSAGRGKPANATSAIRPITVPQNRVTDHRIELTLYNLPFVLEGDLDGIIEPLMAQRLVRKS